AVHGRISVPSLFAQLLKFVLPLLAIGYYSNLYAFDSLLVYLLIYYVLLGLSFVLYMLRHEKIRPKIAVTSFSKELDLKPMAVFAFFSVLTGIGGTLTNQIDVIMITSLKGTYQNGLYSWSLFIANAVAIPFSLIVAISTPIVAKYWKDNDLDGIRSMYRRTSSSLLVFSLGAFLSFWLVVDDLFLLMPKGNEFMLAKSMVLMLCVAKIIDMASGINSQILSMSKDYKLLLWMLLLSAAVNVGLNFLLIPQYGIEGSGVATIISIIVFNVAKFWFLKKKYNFNPFNKATLQVLALSLLSYLVISILPRTSIPIINLFLFSGLFILTFGLAAYKLKLAPEINGFVNKQLKRINIKPFD
ncbi:MAG: polysaccharide biosynthesis C-terminal domain-containing protein, partial [Bacteroidia bacterium]|nr:polysaccharide biosynthesis C-terminal domain-containing protein [Bacteroidia bacterium]